MLLSFDLEFAFRVLPRLDFLHSGCFGRIGTAPKRARIDAIGIEFQHPVVEFARSLRRLVQTDKVADVSPRLFDVLGIVIVLRHLMPGNDRARVQRLDLVKRSDPLEPGL